eukprot:TRINITY_DN3376_c0_g2_i2.p1 TRINITY_DN3376_c0_g2~~TRINITY_DN3376_c0_g2_i2.p1  ORF type:complete len:121 (+),score=15.76 TRINITY_DN3376_c0_g2_i2:28-363(+)
MAAEARDWSLPDVAARVTCTCSYCSRFVSFLNSKDDEEVAFEDIGMDETQHVMETLERVRTTKKQLSWNVRGPQPTTFIAHKGQFDDVMSDQERLFRMMSNIKSQVAQEKR